MNDLNPSRFIELAEKVQQDAKAAAIALLRDKVENHVIDSDLIENALDNTGYGEVRSHGRKASFYNGFSFLINVIGELAVGYSLCHHGDLRRFQ